MDLWELPRWRNTHVAEDRLRQRDGYEEPAGEELHGTWQGRPIIGRDTPICGGVYVGSSSREAIVVDEYPDGLLTQVYDTLVRQRDEVVGTGGHWNVGIMQTVYDLVRLVMPYSQRIVDEVGHNYGASHSDVKIRLDRFVEAGGGVCRHQALLAGYLLEKAINEHRLRGRVSVDRNILPAIGGHAWTRYVTSDRRILIIDAAQSYCGLMMDTEGKQFGPWFYARPGEIPHKG